MIFTFLALLSSINCQKIGPEDCKLLKAEKYLACVMCADNRHKKTIFNTSNPSLNVSDYSTSKVAFENIYNSSLWGTQGGGSGTGSHKDVSLITGYLIRYIVFKYNIISFMDAPCGAVWDSWMSETLMSLLKDIPCFTYQGIDVVSSVVNLNRFAFRNNTDHVSFTTGDVSSIIASPLPKNYDMILSRDALQHSVLS